MSIAAIGAIGTVLFNIVKAILPSASDITKVVLGNQAAQANNNAEADKAAQEAYSKEFSYPLGPHRTRFDAFMDGVNRLPRPALVVIVFGMISLPIFDAEKATHVYRSLQLVPDMLWQLAILIISFYFVSRAIEKVKFGPYRAPSPVAKVRVEPEEATKPDRTETFDATSVFGIASVSDPLLAMAGFGPGQLSKHGYSGKLPISRASGWRNPIAQRYVVDDEQ